MTGPESTTMFCTICGGPIFQSSVYDHLPWLSKAILLTTQQNPNEVATIDELAVDNAGGPFFQLPSANERVTACNVAIQSPFINPKPPLYIPSHENCLLIAKRAIASRSNDPSEQAKLLRHIWQVLEARFKNDSAGKRVPLHKLWEPSGYYGACKFQEMEWEPGNDPERNFEAQHFEADPIDIFNLTNSILSHLQSRPSSPSCPPHNQEYSPQRSHSPTAHLPSPILPYLWDLDPTLIGEKEQKAPPGTEWDWDLLTQQLARTEIQKVRGVWTDVPLGVRNRRRIWRLVEDLLQTSVRT